MIDDLVLLRLLQGGSSLAFVGLLSLLAVMKNVPIWLRLPVFLLAFCCVTTFLTTIFMEGFILFMVIVTIFMLGVVSVVAVFHSYIKPIPDDGKAAMNRRLLWYSIPAIGVLFTLWALSATYEGGLKHLINFEYKLDKSLRNQETMSQKISRNLSFIVTLGKHQMRADSSSAMYRAKLDRELTEIKTDLKGTKAQVSDQRRTIEWLKLQQQKDDYKNRNR